MLLLFVLEALEDRNAEEQLKFISECNLLKDIFRRVVNDPKMFEVANLELISQNIDACLLLLTVVKEEFAELKLKNAYEMLIVLPKLD